MAKRIEISPNKAYRVEGIEISGEKYVSIRQLYKTKKQPDEWQVGRQGVTLPLKESERIAKAIVAIAKGSSFKTISKN